MKPSMNYNSIFAKKYMKAAIEEGEKCKLEGRKVGAIIVKDDKIVGRGYRGGQRKNPYIHAEQLAIMDAKHYIDGATLHGSSLYVTLMPCTKRNQGFEDPCCDQIIVASITEVIYAWPDNNEKALHKLESAGIIVKQLHLGLEDKIINLLHD